MAKKLIPKGQENLKVRGRNFIGTPPDMSDRVLPSSTRVAVDTLPQVVYQPYHESEFIIENNKIKKVEPSDAEVSWRKIQAAKTDTRTEDEKERDRINQAIAKTLLELYNDPVYKFTNTIEDVINDTRHMLPAIFMTTKNPFLFGIGAGWEGANLAYDAYHNDVPGMYRSVFEPAGFAALDAVASPATWQFLKNATRNAGSYVYNRAINPVALFANNEPITLLGKKILLKASPSEAVTSPVAPVVEAEKPTLKEMRQYVQDELSKQNIVLNPSIDNVATIEDLYDSMKEFNKSYSLKSATKIDLLMGNSMYTTNLMNRLREAVLAGDLDAIDLYRNSTYYTTLGGITGDQLKAELRRKQYGSWTPVDDLNLKQKLILGLGYFSEFNNPNITREAFQIAQILKETPGSLIYEHSLSTNSAPLYYNLLIRNLRNNSIKGLDLITTRRLNTLGHPYYLHRRPNGKIVINKHPGDIKASDLDIIDYLLNPQIKEINNLWPGNNFPYATLDKNRDIIIPYLRAHFKRGGKLIKRKKKV